MPFAFGQTEKKYRHTRASCIGPCDGSDTSDGILSTLAVEAKEVVTRSPKYTKIHFEGVFEYIWTPPLHASAYFKV
jgi:hypothetical protein